jgi:hypothetical protein
MIVHLFDADGNEYPLNKDITEVDIYMPVTITHLANEYGIQIRTHGAPSVRFDTHVLPHPIGQSPSELPTSTQLIIRESF